jgi:hypothetical protein
MHSGLFAEDGQRRPRKSEELIYVFRTVVTPYTNLTDVPESELGSTVDVISASREKVCELVEQSV